MSARRPGHLPACQEVHVQVGDAFASIRAVVDNDTEAPGEFRFFRKVAGHQQEMAQQVNVAHRCFREAWNRFSGNYEQVGRRLRIEVVDYDATVIFVGDVGGNFTVDNFLEYGFIAHVRRLM